MGAGAVFARIDTAVVTRVSIHHRGRPLLLELKTTTPRMAELEQGEVRTVVSAVIVPPRQVDVQYCLD
jgi:hypothetical protein